MIELPSPTGRAVEAYELLEVMLGPVMPVLSRCARGMFVADEGMRFIGGDFANIEGRINAWMADEHWKLQAFRDYDNKVGPDLYNLSYANSFGVNDLSLITTAQRQVGKVQELACGYQGSIGAYINMAANYNVKPRDIVRTVRPVQYGTDKWLKACEQYDSSNNHYGLTSDEWVCIKIVVNGFRDANPRIVQSWWDRQDAAIEAVEFPDTVVNTVEDRNGVRRPLCGGRIRYMSSEGFLWCQLPSGKMLAYCKPHLVTRQENFLVDGEGEVFPVEEFTVEELKAQIEAGGTIREGRAKTSVRFEGKNQKTQAWGYQHLYGGLQCNNDVQGTARELLRFAMMNTRKAGYPCVLHVHDELVAEVDKNFGSPEHFREILGLMPFWLAGCPVSSKTWTDHRFLK